MVSEKLFQNAKPGDNLVENEMCGCLTIRFNCGHSLYPFCEVIYDEINMMVPPSQNWVVIHKIKPPLGEGTNGGNRMQRGGTRAYITCKHLERVALLNYINAILK